MVKGIEAFKEHFAAFADAYILIGGSACDILFGAAGETFRRTKDLDLVLTLEVVDGKFGEAMWRFVELGGYSIATRGDGKECFYRFQKPTNETFPAMIELFSRSPDFAIAHDSGKTPIPFRPVDDADAKSLSAILMDTDYYDFIHSGRIVVDGVTVIEATHLIPLKLRAWMDHLERKAAGEKVDGYDLKKHRNDVFRLAQLLVPGRQVEMAESIRHDVGNALTRMATEPVDQKSIGLRTPFEEVMELLRRVYLPPAADQRP